MKFSVTLLFLSLVVLTVAQTDSGLKGAADPAPPKAPVERAKPAHPAKPARPAQPAKPAKPATPAKPAANQEPKLASPISPCEYSCPLRDASGTPLVKKPSAFGWDFDGYFVGSAVGRAAKGKGETKGKGWYDVFECVYNHPRLESKEHTCSYYKHDGTHALGHEGDKCPSQAPPCPRSPPAVPKLGLSADEDEESTAALTPHFSSSQLDGAELLDPVRGVYKYKDTMETSAWVNEGRIYVGLKEHPPLKLD